MKDNQCVAFLQWALPKMNMRWPGFRKVRRQVCRRISKRIAALHLPDYQSYRHYVEEHFEEWQLLDSFCRITISRFYRDKHIFDTLAAHVLPLLAEIKNESGESMIRCWCAGCASGEEPFTLALIWHKYMAPTQVDIGLHITATDIDPVMLERAAKGCYQGSSVRELPDVLREEGLIKKGGEFCVLPSLHKFISFEQGDVRKSKPDGSFDLIFCRNLVFTYYDLNLQQEILDRFYDCLRSNGFLILGTHEKLPPQETRFFNFKRHQPILAKK